MAPTIVLVPGMFSVGSVWYEPLKQELVKSGLSNVIVVDLPSVDSMARAESLKPNALEFDIHHVRYIVQSLVEDGKDVVIGAHSLGGTPTLYASEGLWKHEREAKGLQGGVLKAVLMSSSLSLPGESIATVRGKWAAEFQPDMVVAQEKSVVEMVDDVPFVMPIGLAEVFLTDMAPEERTNWAERGLRPHPLGSVLASAPQGTPSSWRIAYLVTAEDPSMPEEHQRWLIENARKAGSVVEQVKVMNSGHFVHVTHTKEVASWFRELCF